LTYLANNDIPIIRQEIQGLCIVQLGQKAHRDKMEVVELSVAGNLLAWLAGIQIKGTKPFALCETPPLPGSILDKQCMTQQNNTIYNRFFHLFLSNNITRPVTTKQQKE
jgi:hypothetical protein